MADKWRPGLALLRRLRIPLLLFLLAALGGWVLHANRTARSDTNRPGAAGEVSTVRAQPARQGDLDISLTGIGAVAAANSVTVRSRVDGELLRLHFEEGQDVRAGDLLAQIDPRSYLVQLEQAEGQLAKDNSLLLNARQDLARYRVLLEQDSVSPQQVDATQADVRQYEGAVKADKAQIDAAKLNLTYCRITAPVGGRLGLRQVDPGNLVSASDSAGIVVITQIKPINVVFTIPDSQLPAVLTAVRQGRSLPVEAWDREDKNRIATGELLAVDNKIDTDTGTVKLKARFENADAMLFPNQFVNVRMRVDTLQGVTLVPDTAIRQGSSGPFVYVVGKERTVALRQVDLGQSGGGLVAVEKGVAPGDLLVVDGLDLLRDGAKVNVVAD